MNKLRHFIFCVGIILSNTTLAELKELDDKSLEEQKGQAGVTIDLEFEFSIGEVAWHFSDGKGIDPRKSQKHSTTLPPRIEYVLPEGK